MTGTEGASSAAPVPVPYAELRQDPAVDDRPVIAVDDPPVGADTAVAEDGPVDVTTGIRLSAWMHRITWWQVGLALVITAYVARFTSLTLDIHHGLGTSSYDFGLYDQGVWLLSRFHAPFVTLMGRNLFGDHTSFILLFLVPAYWLFPAAGTLLFSQSLALGLGAVPVFLYARTRLTSEWMALVLATVYLLHPAVGWTNLENFHPDSYLGVLVGFAIWAALTRRWKTYAVFVVLSLLVKEDVSLLVVPLGVWVALKRDRRIGLITIIGSIGFMAIALLVVIKGLIGTATRNSWRFPFGGPMSFLGHTFQRPGDTLAHLWSDDRPWYVWQMLTPFAWLWARRPSVAAIGSLVLAGNVVSTYWYQYNIEYHYSLIIVPALALGTVYGIAALGPRGRTYAVGAVGIVALYTSYLWGPMPWSRTDLAYWPPSHPVAVELREIIAEIPPKASVSAQYSASAQIDHRVEIYQFPNPFRIVLYGPDTSLEGTRDVARADGVEYVLLPVSKDQQMTDDWDAIASAFTLVDSNTSWELYKRSGPLPPLRAQPAPDAAPTESTTPTSTVPISVGTSGG